MNTSDRSLVPEDEARRLLSPHLDKIRGCITSGFERWRQVMAASPIHCCEFHSRTKAGAINDLVIAEARTAFEQDKDVGVDEKFGFPVFVVQGRLLMRFKLCDKHHLPRNYPTGQQTKIKAQQLDLPGMPADATWVCAGYRLTKAGDQVRDLCVSCLREDKRLWRLSLDQAEGEGDLFVAPAPPAPPLPPPSVKAKGHNKREAHG
jgi:hypothetical protein